jgi:prepilin-type N-terminal cleavage/methylation domain-containing protein
MRCAFTLIELLVVLSIMALLSALAAPAMLRASQRARIGDAAGRIQQTWMQARVLAMQEQPAMSEDANGNGALDAGEDRNGNGVLDSSTRPWHYGIVLVQPASGAAWTGLIYDNRGTAAIQADPEGALLLRQPGQPVWRRDLPGGLRLGTAAAFGGSGTPGAIVLVVYAQFGTGCPVSATAVAAGSGASSGLASLGTKTSPVGGQPGTVQLLSPGETTPVADIAIHEAGVCIAQVR